MKNKYRLTAIILLLCLLVFVVAKQTYSFFSASKNNDEDTTAIVNSVTLAMEHVGCNNLIFDNALPGAVITCDFSVTNNSDLLMLYDYDFIDVLNEFESREDLVYSVRKNGVIIRNDIFPNQNIKLSVDNCLDAHETDIYTLRVEYLNQEFDQNIDMDKTASGKVSVTNVESTNSCHTRSYNVTIDPNGGEWNDVRSPSIFTVESGNTVDISTAPFNEGYTFRGWSFSKDTIVKDSKITVDKDITATAVWDVSEDCVARIDDRYFLTLEKAHTAAVAGDTITMIKNTQETVTMTKDVTLDLNGYTVDGLNNITITNTGNLTIIGNGEVTNNNDKAIVNTGELTLGKDDGVVSITAPRIYGKNIGIEQDNLFNFYDGIIIGITGCIGTYDQIPENYYVFVNHNDETGNQEVYLVNVFTTRAIARIDKVIYMNLQDAIDLNTEGNTIYFIRDCELPYPFTNYADVNTVLDMSGFNIESGYAITNNGNLTITDTGSEKGIWNSSVAITNNDYVLIKDASMYSTTDTYVILNNKNLYLENSLIKGSSSAGIQNYDYLKLDTSSVIDSENAYGLGAYDSALIEGTGKIYGLVVATTNTGLSNSFDKAAILNGPEVINESNHHAIYLTPNSEFIMQSGKIKVNNDSYSGLYLVNSNTVRIDGGDINIDAGNYGIRADVNSLHNLIINNVNATSTAGTFMRIDNNNVTINGGIYRLKGKIADIYNSSYLSSTKVTINGGDYACEISCFYVSAGDLEINDGKFISTGYGIENYNGTIYFNDGEIFSDGSTIYSSYGRGMHVRGGTLSSNNSYAIHLNKYSFANITGGSLTSKATYGVYSNATGGIAIGTNDATISYEIPRIMGKTYAVYHANGPMDVYDGIFYGETDSIYGLINVLPANCILSNNNVTIEGKIYVEGTIRARAPYLQVGEELFNDPVLAVAAANASEDHIVKAITDEDYTDSIVVPSGNTVVFDINGHNIRFLKAASNSGTLDFIDSSADKTGTITSSGNTLISNGGTMNVRSGKYTGTGGITFANSGTLNLYDGKYNSSGAATLYNSGTMHFYNGNLSTNDYGVYQDSPGMFYFHDGLLESGNVGLAGGGEFYVYDGEISTIGTSIAAGQRYHNSSVDIQGGEIHSNGSVITSNNGTYISVKSGHLYSTGSAATIYPYQSSGVIKGNAIVENLGTGYALRNYSGNFSVEGGTLNAKNNVAIYTSSGTVTIGKNDGEVSISSPNIIGATYAIDGTGYNFYDGILKGKTGAINATIYSLVTGYEIVTDTEVIDDATYESKYLLENIYFLEYNGETYNKFSELMPHIPTDDTLVTVNVIADAAISEVVVFPIGTNVTLELDGHSLSNKKNISTSGALTLIDSSENHLGSYSSIELFGLTNNGTKELKIENIIYSSGINGTGTLRAKNVTINSSANGGVRYNGTVIFDNVTYGIYNFYNTGDSTISNSYISGGLHVSGTSSINGGTYNEIYQENGTLTINDGSINYVSVNNVVNIIDGNIIKIYVASGTLNILGGNIVNNNENPLRINNNANLNMTGGNILADRNEGIFAYSSAKLNITGGNITSISNYGVHLQQYTTLNIGSNDSTVNANFPVIKGKTYGVYSENGTVNFYDGKIMGQTNGYNIISSIPDNYEVVSNVVDLDGERYVVRTLMLLADYIKNGSTTYNNLADALDEANSGDSLNLIADGKTYYSVSIPSDKVITIDMAGHNIELNSILENNGTLNIINSSEEESTLSSPTLITYGLINRGVMSLNNINYNGLYAINNFSEADLNLTDVSINMSNRAINNIGKITTTNSNITSTSGSAIYGTGTLPVNITGGSVSGYEFALYNSATDVTISDCNVKGSIYNDGANTLTFNDVTVNPDDKYYEHTINNNGGHIIANNLSIIGHTNYYKKNIHAVNSVGGSITGNKLLVNITASPSTSSYRYDFSALGTSNTTVDIDVVDLTVNQAYEYYNNNILIASGSEPVNVEHLIINGTSTNRNSNINGVVQNGTGVISIGEITCSIDSPISTAACINNVSTGYINFNTGSINMTGNAILYGVINNSSGGIVIGVEDGNVSTTNPTITAINTTTAIAVKKINGYIEYYDGIIKGSTAAKPETTSLVEPGYEVTFYNDDDGYEYCILEYMTD